MKTTLLNKRSLDAIEAALIYVAALLLVLVLAGCGGGGDGDANDPPPQTPAIVSFTPERQTHFVGDAPRVTAVFSGGSGRIVNLASPQTSIPALSGQAVALPSLTETSTYRLIVETNTTTLNRDLTLTVAMRGRYARQLAVLAAIGHDTIAMPDGSAIVTGGSRGEGVLSNAIDRFDPATGQLTRVGSLLSGRERHRTVLLASGDLLVVGGQTALTNTPNVELVNKSNWTASATGTMSVPRIDHAAVALKDGRVLVAGGFTPERFPDANSPTAEIYDPATRSFRKLASLMNSARTAHSMIRLDDGRVLILGGYSAGAHTFAELFNPVNETFTAVTSPVTTQRALLAVERASDGTVIIVGGEANEASFSNEVLRFNPVTNTIVATQAQLPSPTSLARAVLLPDRTIGVFGGASAAAPLGTTAAYAITPLAGGNGATLQILPPLPQLRVWHTATRLATGQTLILGGQRGSGFETSVELFD